VGIAHHAHASIWTRLVEMALLFPIEFLFGQRFVEVSLLFFKELLGLAVHAPVTIVSVSMSRSSWLHVVLRSSLALSPTSILILSISSLLSLEEMLIRRLHDVFLVIRFSSSGVLLHKESLFISMHSTR